MIPAIDAHHHLWDPARNALPWLRPEHEALARRFEPSDLEPLLAPAGVERTVLVQSANSIGDTEQMLVWARTTEWIAAVVVWLPLESPAATRGRLEELRAEPKVRGVRHLIHDEPDPHWILQPKVLESLELLEAEGLVLELPVVWPRHLADVAELARRLPALSIVVDHLGKPPLDGPGLDGWAAALETAAEAGPNVVAKVSGLNTATSDPRWNAATLEPAVGVAFGAFGPGRVLCGSDWPVANLNGDYGRVWNETRRVIASVAAGHEEQLLSTTAARLYGLGEEPNGAH